jgi:hypothetical protein
VELGSDDAERGHVWLVPFIIPLESFLLVVSASMFFCFVTTVTFLSDHDHGDGAGEREEQEALFW